MKSYLLYRDADLDLDRPLPPNAAALSQDLELGVLLQGMAGGDEFLGEVARSVLHASLTSPEDIRYRQDILTDCIRHPEPVLQMYGLAAEAVTTERGIYSDMFSSPGSVLRRSVEALHLFDRVLRQLRSVAEEQIATFTSAGFSRFFGMLRSELDDAYFERYSITSASCASGTACWSAPGSGRRIRERATCCCARPRPGRASGAACRARTAPPATCSPWPTGTSAATARCQT